MPNWFGSSSEEPGPLPEIKLTTSARVLWQAPVGKAAAGLAPAVVDDAIYVAATDGAITRLRCTHRAQRMAHQRRQAALGRGRCRRHAPSWSAPTRARCSRSARTGAPLWQVRVTSEVMAPPVVGDGIVAVWSGDGKIHGLNAADGKTRWVHQRANPPLTIRNAAGGVINRGGLFTGTAGGRLVALDLATGAIGWESSVATPKGATELERIADVTSLPAVDDRRACAIAYQGRIACFDVVRGVLEWSRNISSLTGIASDERNLYVTDDRGSVHALDKSTGASVWKQDRLAKRHPGGPQIVGDFLGVVDAEGYLHLLDRNEGTLVGRARHRRHPGHDPTGPQRRRRDLAERWRQRLCRHRPLSAARPGHG